MEKSGRIKMTTMEFAIFSELGLPQSISQNWGITSYQELQDMINSGNYEIVKDYCPPPPINNSTLADHLL